MSAAGWLQVPLWQPEVTWTAPALSALPSWADAKRVCVDLECRDDDLTALGPGVRRGAYYCGVAFAIEDGPAFYLPTRHEGGGNVDAAHVRDYLRDQSRVFTGTVVGANLQYDLDYLWEDGVVFERAQWHRDVIAVAEPLLDELQDEYNLDAVLQRRGLAGKDESELARHAKAWGVHPKKGLWRLPAGAVGRYAERDVRAPLELLRRQERELEDQELGEVYDLESRVTLALLRMTRRGIRVDLAALDAMERWALKVIAEEQDRIYAASGVRITSIANAGQVGAALRAVGVEVPDNVHPQTGKLSPRIRKDWLAAVDHPVAKSVARARVFAKLSGTYARGLRAHLVGDRVHPSFKQSHSASDDEDEEDEGARYGRCAAHHPNVQAQMKRNKEIKTRWRKVFVAEHGQKWCRADYSQQEPRTTVHYAEVCELAGAREAAQRYRDDPMTDSYQILVDLTGLKRDEVKDIFLGRSYGMGTGKMARRLGLPTVMRESKYDGAMREYAGPEAQKIIDQFDGAVPFIRALSKRCEAVAKSRGFLKILGGRRCRFPKDQHGNFDYVYKALNRLIQGSAATQTKKALVDLDAMGFELRLTVHDEFDLSLDDPTRMREVVDTMKAALPLNIPSRVDVEVGDSYGDGEAFAL